MVVPSWLTREGPVACPCISHHSGARPLVLLVLTAQVSGNELRKQAGILLSLSDRGTNGLLPFSRTGGVCLSSWPAGLILGERSQAWARSPAFAWAAGSGPRDVSQHVSPGLVGSVRKSLRAGAPRDEGQPGLAVQGWQWGGPGLCGV